MYLKSDSRIGLLSGLFFSIVLTWSVACAETSSAQTLTTLVNFNGSNGSSPLYGSLSSDANGDLFGTTNAGGPGFSSDGSTGAGTAFEIVKTTDGYTATPTMLVNFDWSNEYFPQSGLIADANGNLFGTTSSGGAFGPFGTVFEIPKTATGYASTPTILFSFDGAHGLFPQSSLIIDSNGDLFGTTSSGGAFRGGTVFEIPKTASGYASTPITRVAFDGNNGGIPFGSLVANSNGDLFGTTLVGGTSQSENNPIGNGTVFEILKTSTGYDSVPITLVNFDGADGKYPYSGLITDANGDLFGTTRLGGTYGYGSVFEIVNTSDGYARTPTILVNFHNTDGAFPRAALIADANGNLFGTTDSGGPIGSYGTVFEIAKTASGYADTPTTLINFEGTNGATPYSGLIADINGNLFGTTTNGGTFQHGTVFEITGSGFVPPVLFSGIPGTPNCVGKSLSTLAQTYGGISFAAANLGYASVADLQSSANSYCR